MGFSEVMKEDFSLKQIRIEIACYAAIQKELPRIARASSSIRCLLIRNPLST